MSIMPSGKRRVQVAQGGMRHTSIFESNMFDGVAEKFAQGNMQMKEMGEPEAARPKDLKMEELQQTMNESNTLPQETPEAPTERPPERPIEGGGGSEFIDISKRISEKVIDALGLSTRPGEHWAGKTEISNDGDEVTGITIKLTRAQPKDMMMQGRVEKGNVPGYGEPMQEGNPAGQPAPAPAPAPVTPSGPVTNSV